VGLRPPRRGLNVAGGLAAAYRDGVAPVWFVVDGGRLAFNTGKNTAKGRALARDPRVTRTGGGYMGADRAEEYGRRNGVPGELVVRIKPTKVRKAFNLAE